MTTRIRHLRCAGQRGMTLLEVALALGLLGMAALGAVAVITQARVVPVLVQREAVATRVAADLIARIQLNPQAWRQGLYDAAIDVAVAAPDTSGPAPSTDCGGAGCTPALRAAADRAAVARALGHALPGATLQVQRTGGSADAARIEIAWPLPQHRWMAASAGNACSAQAQCLRIDFAP